MPYVKRGEAPSLYYELDDCTDPWRPRSRPEQLDLLRRHVRRVNIVELDTEYYMVYNVYPRACAQAVLHFAAQHDGVACHE